MVCIATLCRAQAHAHRRAHNPRHTASGLDVDGDGARSKAKSQKAIGTPIRVYCRSAYTSARDAAYQRLELRHASRPPPLQRPMLHAPRDMGPHTVPLLPSSPDPHLAHLLSSVSPSVFCIFRQSPPPPALVIFCPWSTLPRSLAPCSCCSCSCFLLIRDPYPLPPCHPALPCPWLICSCPSFPALRA